MKTFKTKLTGYAFLPLFALASLLLISCRKDDPVSNTAMKKTLSIIILVFLFTNFNTLFAQPNVTLLWEKIANVTAMKFTYNGQHLVTGGYINSCSPYTCGQLKIWRISDSTLIRTISNPNMGLTNDITFSLNGQNIISGHGSVYCAPGGGCYVDRGGQFKIDFASGNIMNSLTGLPEIILSIDLSPDGSLIAVGTGYNNNGDIKIYNASDYTLIRTLDGHTYETNSVKFSTNGQILISGGHDGLVKFWNVSDGALIRTVTHGTYSNGGWDVMIALSSDGQYAASAGQGYSITAKIWRISDGLLIHTLNVDPAPYGGYNSIQFSPNNVYLSCGVHVYGSGGLGWYGRLQFWRVSDGVLAQEYIDTVGSPSAGGVRAIAFSSIGNNYFAYAISNRLRIATTNLNLVAITSAGNNEGQVPANYTLYQNYPNPFNPNTVINYQLPASSYVTLKVFDALGKEVATIVNEKHPAGIYEVEFNGSNLSSGIYFYTLETGSFTETKSMILLK